MRRALVPLLALALLVVSAAPAGAANTIYIVKFGTPDGTFTATITDPASVERLRTATGAHVGIPNGVLVRGTGDNRGHAWHLEDVELVDVTIEVCDGTAAMVDAELDRWIAENGRFCPWGARMLWYHARG